MSPYGQITPTVRRVNIVIFKRKVKVIKCIIRIRFPRLIDKKIRRYEINRTNTPTVMIRFQPNRKKMNTERRVTYLAILFDYYYTTTNLSDDVSDTKNIKDNLNKLTDIQTRREDRIR